MFDLRTILACTQRTRPLSPARVTHWLTRQSLRMHVCVRASVVGCPRVQLRNRRSTGPGLKVSPRSPPSRATARSSLAESLEGMRALLTQSFCMYRMITSRPASRAFGTSPMNIPPTAPVFSPMSPVKPASNIGGDGLNGQATDPLQSPSRGRYRYI